MFDHIEIFRMSSAMAQHASRQQALVSQNVANADTPGYHARSMIDFETSFQTDSAQRSTRASHLSGRDATDFEQITASEAGASPNGNSVSLEAEMLKSTAAKSQHDRALAIYKSALNVLRGAVRS